MKGLIALFVHNPTCSSDSGNGIMRALGDAYSFKIFGKKPVNPEFFDDVDIVAVPGGLGDARRFRTVMRHNADPIRRFVADGGRYLGICMGAYWAGHHYLDILRGVRTTQYITRPGRDTHRPHPKGLEVSWEGKREVMYFYDGPSMVGAGGRFRTVARYPNGDPMAIMQRGIGLIGCHPEAEKWWYREHSWMPRHWHNYRHHELLRQFVDELMLR